MASIPEVADAPITNDLEKLHFQVDGARTSLEVLGLSASTSWAVADFRIAYRALALRLHPDKCPPSQAELYTRLFAKVQNAYEDLCKQGQHDQEREKERHSEFSAPRPAESGPKVQLQKQRQQPIPDLSELKSNKGQSSKSRNNKKQRDQRHAGKDMKAEERYQQAWQEERERRWKREKQSKLSPGGAGNNVVASKK